MRVGNAVYAFNVPIRITEIKNAIVDPRPDPGPIGAARSQQVVFLEVLLCDLSRVLLADLDLPDEPAHVAGAL